MSGVRHGGAKFMEKQDAILRALVYDEEVSLAVIDMTQTVNEAVRIHDLSALSAAALGRTLIAAAYMCSSLKEEKGALSVTVRGDGVGGNTLYVGGIAGRIWSDDNGDGDKGTAIIDCFSTAEMNYYCATYVSVLGVNVGHIGGITAEVWDDNCSITRCHYAGRATSYQYNGALSGICKI